MVSAVGVEKAVSRLGRYASDIDETAAAHTAGWFTAAAIVGTAGSLITLGTLNAGGRNSIVNVVPGSVTALGVGIGGLLVGKYLGGSQHSVYGAALTGAGAGLTAAGAATAAAGGVYNAFTWQ